MKSIKIIFGTHNSQPVGNFDYINEKIYQQAYKPFLRTLYEFPDFPITMYYSGILLEWMEENHPEFMMLLDEMVKRKQVELLGGGFYEPILSIIPNSDKLGQIEALTTYIRSRFSKRPRGSWITERVWEPYMASILQNSGMEYLFLDDLHLKSTGLTDDQLFYPYLTEDQGRVVVVFPLSTSLTNMMLNQQPAEIIAHLAELATDKGDRVVAIIDNGEKYGDWEGSYNHLYEEKWLEQFITLLQENSDWIEPIHPLRYMKKFNCRGLIYMGCLLYEEMYHWLANNAQAAATGAELCTTGHRGSSFKGFLCKYPESNLLYSKMIYVSVLVNQIRGDKYKKKAAKEELWRGQCHSVYWHGNFDGLYSNHLRKKIYQALLEAEKLTRLDGVFMPSIVATDFDTDGRSEYLYQGATLNAYIHSRGGCLFELDYLPISWNYLDTVNRHKEPYHDVIARHNNYDWYLRKAFIDHFFDRNLEPEYFQSMTYPEAGDFITGYYEVDNLDKENFQICLRRTGIITRNNITYSVKLQKTYSFENSSLEVGYQLTNLADAPLNIRFAVENNLALAASGQDNHNILKLPDYTLALSNQSLDESGITSFIVRDLKNQVDIECTTSPPAGLWSFPLETFSRTLDKLNKIYQASCFLLHWDLNLQPGEDWKTKVKLAFSKLKN